MIARIAATVLMLAVGAVTPVTAAPVKTIPSLDFMVEAPKLIGQRVRIENQRVDGLSFQGGFLRLSGGSALLQGPWSDREDFRRLIPACEKQWFDKPEDEAACVVTIEGTVKAPSGDYPVLTDVDFIFP
ncbi:MULTISPECIES: hypothetical protein [unclassified Aureimonas]|uniref:hypothetical protein n=1 Tax=unclassified Aureimonas TaxID=2615206 RepID=UPI0006FE00C7|nr:MULTISPECIES: hypothetical protein [unclassified Aureimonas]KQT52224.1 hypothetical protein ASG62_16330 [Aureimonas sp. Leaf427]KQT70542.1 hypothetical protein ASG54_21620 [Aureimonas sp. Leaf460]